MSTELIEVQNQLLSELSLDTDIVELLIQNYPQYDAKEITYFKELVDHLITVDLKRARKLAEATWELARRSGDQTSLAYGEAALGRVEYCHGHYSQAQTHYEKALKLMAGLDLPVACAILQKQLVCILMYLGNHREALKLATMARKVLRAHHEEEQLAELETNVGNLYCYLLNQYRKALRYYQRAWQILHRLGREVSLARVGYNMANALTDLDCTAEALSLYRHSTEIYRKHNMLVYAGQAEYNIAYLLLRQGQYNESLNHYFKVRDRQQELGDDVSVAWCNMDLAELYLQLSVYEESASLAMAARKSFLAFENIFKAAWAQTLGGLALAGLGRLESARRELSAALEDFSRQSSRVMVGLLHTYLADLEIRAGNYQLAGANAKEAERIFLAEHLSTKVALARLLQAKLAYLTGDLTRAQQLLRAVKQKAEEYSLSWLKYECHYLKACLHESAGEQEEALAEFTHTIELIGQTRSHLGCDELKSAFLRDKMDIFEQAISFSLKHGDHEKTLWFVEQAKSRSLADLLSHYVERELAGQLTSPELRNQFHEILNSLNWFRSAQQLKREAGCENNVNDRSQMALSEKQLHYEQELKEILRRIQLEHASYAQLQSPATITLSEIQQTLNADEILVEYFGCNGMLSAFIITQTETTLLRNLISETQLSELLQGWQFQMEKFQLGQAYIHRHLARLSATTNEYLHQMYKYLILPWANQLINKGSAVENSKLIIIPHGLLHYVPFQALFNGTKYLIEDYDLSYAPSLTVYQLCNNKQVNDQGPILIFGLDDESAPEIAYEVKAIAQLQPDSFVLSGKQATIQNLKQYGPHCRILHLATHGVVRPDNPLFSYLKMADGELSFYNTFDLKLNAQLITLSACNTGINHIFPGDELHGLMRGFLYAGTPSLIVSLLEADDRATSNLMINFYRQLLDGISLRAAFCQAQREMIKEWQHPYYWSAFILIGKP